MSQFGDFKTPPSKGPLSIGISLKGMTELNRKLRTMPAKIRRAYERKIIGSGNKIIRQAARAAWKKAVPGTTTATDLISKVVTVGRGENKTVVGITGPVIPGKAGRIANRFRWVEFGTKPRQHELTGKAVGMVRPRPWLRPAWDRSVAKIEREMLNRGWAEIQKAATSRA